MSTNKKPDLKIPPSNFKITLESRDFSVEPIRCSRARIRIDVPSIGRRGIVDSGFRLELIPMASGILEIRVWLGSKFLLKKIKTIDGLIDWSVVDGRKISELERIADKKARSEAKKILRAKCRKRVLNVEYRGEVDPYTANEPERSEGEVLDKKAPNPQKRGEDV